MTYRDRCRPRTQAQADAWAEALDLWLTGRSTHGQIVNQRQDDTVAQELDRWIERFKEQRT